MSDYLLASDDELTRLQLQARVWESHAEALLAEIGMMPDWSCLDLGCGAMGILGPSRRRTQGRVLGLDADETLLAAARVYAESEGLEGVDFLHGDALRTGLPRESFDLVHTRFLFPHIDPNKLLKEMIGLTGPGGVVVAQEPDHSSWHFYPMCSAWTEFLALLERALALRGDINIGRRLYSLFRETGFEQVKVRAGVVALQDRHPYMTMTLPAARAMKGKMVAAGLVTEAKLNELIKAVEGCAEDENRMQVSFTTIQVWGRKPLG